MPVVLTLHSGAALARSSNMLSGAADQANLKYDGEGRLLCLDTMSVDPDPAGSPNIYDLGPQPSANFYAINKRNYHREKNASDPLTAEEICDQQGVFYYKVNSANGTVWQQTVDKKKGMLVSANAMQSFAGAAFTYTDL